MSLIRVIILAIVQGLAELLPVSSSAHVIVAEKLMGMDPAAPDMTLLLVMLHTGTMFAVIVYFWTRWKRAFFENAQRFKKAAVALILATALTGIVGYGIIKGIEKTIFRDQPQAWVEQLFDRLDLIAPALAVAGVLILIAGFKEGPGQEKAAGSYEIPSGQSGLIGAVQGLCLPFRGFSRSGATISTAMLAGVPRPEAEDFSFALAVLITPAAIGREVLRLAETVHGGGAGAVHSAIVPSLIGTVFAFLAGLLALKWLSQWLETGKWYLFGIYCLVAAAAIEVLSHLGY
jgi:undecaprenyl-diphosphatase